LHNDAMDFLLSNPTRKKKPPPAFFPFPKLLLFFSPPSWNSIYQPCSECPHFFCLSFFPIFASFGIRLECWDPFLVNFPLLHPGAFPHVPPMFFLRTPFLYNLSFLFPSPKSEVSFTALFEASPTLFRLFFLSDQNSSAMSTPICPYLSLFPFFLPSKCFCVRVR